MLNNFIFYLNIQVFCWFRLRLNTHQNPFIKNLATLAISGNPSHRLKRKWCRDLLHNNPKSKKKKQIKKN